LEIVRSKEKAVSVDQTFGTPEQKVLMARLSKRISELSGVDELAIRGYIRKSLETALGDGSMKQTAKMADEDKVKLLTNVVHEVIRKTRMDEKIGLDAAIKIFQEWKREFRNEKTPS